MEKENKTKTRLYTPPVAGGWAGAVMSWAGAERPLHTKSKSGTDRPTDRPTDTVTYRSRCPRPKYPKENQLRKGPNENRKGEPISKLSMREPMIIQS